jgi:hypothetical protein
MSLIPTNGPMVENICMGLIQTERPMVKRSDTNEWAHDERIYMDLISMDRPMAESICMGLIQTDEPMVEGIYMGVIPPDRPVGRKFMYRSDINRRACG